MRTIAVWLCRGDVPHTARLVQALAADAAAVGRLARAVGPWGREVVTGGERDRR